MMSSRIVLFLAFVLSSAWVLSRPDRLSAQEKLSQREGRYLRLTTDLSSEQEQQAIVESFDAAVPQWFRFWGLTEQDVPEFKVEACVMRDKSRFLREGLIPAEVPNFPFGYALGNRIWVMTQQSEYYTRHLVLHEGVHSLAFAAFGGGGPTWYQEGTAELLATHSGTRSQLAVNHVPQSREEVPYWGRFKRMSQLRDGGQVPSLRTVMRYQPDLTGDVGTYGWSWAAAMILQAYPEYRAAFQAAARNGRIVGPGFNRRLRQSLRDQWPVLLARWRIMVNDIDYGFDWSREQVKLSVDDPIWDGKTLELSISSDRGWQSAGVRIPRGAVVRIAPRGEVTLAETSRPWVSQPPGITFEYYRGRPLGQLQVCLLPNAVDIDADVVSPLSVSELTGETVIDVEEYSWMLFRINDDIRELGDNRGAYQVAVSR